MITECPENFAPIITSTYGLSEITKAFEEACDSHKNIKVLIDHSK